MSRLYSIKKQTHNTRVHEKNWYHMSLRRIPLMMVPFSVTLFDDGHCSFLNLQVLKPQKTKKNLVRIGSSRSISETWTPSVGGYSCICLFVLFLPVQLEQASPGGLDTKVYLVELDNAVLFLKIYNAEVDLTYSKCL